MADTTVSNTVAERRAGSSPALGTSSGDKSVGSAPTKAAKKPEKKAMSARRRDRTDI